jgi:cation diffusion facilitator family transporter
MSNQTDSTKVIFFALLANLGIAASKLAGAFISKSSAMFSEAIHSLVDTLNQILLIIGHKRAQLPPTEKHPLGYGAESFFWSFLVAILLFSMGGLFAIREGIHKLTSPEAIHAPWISLGILIVSLILESLSFRSCLSEIKSKNQNLNLWSWFKNTTQAELLVVFTEDLAALMGLLVATLSLILAWVTGDSKWDAIGSISVGTILVVVAILLSIEIRSLLIGEAPGNEFKTYIEKEVRTWIPEGRVLRFLALQQGGGRVLISYKIHPGSVTDVKTLIELMNQIEKNTKIRFPEIAWQFVEPDFEA